MEKGIGNTMEHEMLVVGTEAQKTTASNSNASNSNATNSNTTNSNTLDSNASNSSNSEEPNIQPRCMTLVTIPLAVLGVVEAQFLYNKALDGAMQSSLGMDFGGVYQPSVVSCCRTHVFLTIRIPMGHMFRNHVLYILYCHGWFHVHENLIWGQPMSILLVCEQL
jgi:hypothetical protein